MYNFATTTVLFPNIYAGFPVFGFNGKENDNEVYGSTGTFQDYGMRMYDTRVCRFISVDPITKKYPMFSPYQFASNTPIWGIDQDGLEVIIYTETTGLGHTFLSVGQGKDLVVYSYGRYTGGDSPESGSADPSGPGVMIKIEGNKAKKYIKHEIKDLNAKAFKINDVKDANVKAAADKIFNSGKELTDEQKEKFKTPYASTDEAKTIDTYDVLYNNCATKSADILKTAGTELEFINNGNLIIPPLPADSPMQMQDYLSGKASNDLKVDDVTNIVKQKVEKIE